MELSPQATEFGSALRDMRVAHGRELADVARALRIRQAFLQAIEDGRFQDLPGPTYAGGFVRAYADYLGLDVNEVMRRYREATGPDGVGAQAALVPPSPMAEGRMPTGFILLVAGVLGALIYGGWYYLTLHGRDAGEVVAELPRQLAEMVGMGPRATPAEPASAGMPERPAPNSVAAVEPPAPKEPPPLPAPKVRPVPPPPAAEVAPAAEPGPRPAPRPPPRVTTSPPPEPAPAPEPPAPAAIETAHAAPPPQAAPEPAPEPAPPPTPAPTAEAPEPAPAAARPEPQREPVAETPPPVAAPQTASQTASQTAEVTAAAPETVDLPPPPARMASGPEPTGGVGRVVLRAASASWVELRDGENRRVFSRLMRAGETYSVPPDRPVTLTTGNAGGLDILVDGKAIPPLGPVGDVRRDISLEPEALLSRLQR